MFSIYREKFPVLFCNLQEHVKSAWIEMERHRRKYSNRLNTQINIIFYEWVGTSKRNYYLTIHFFQLLVYDELKKNSKSSS